MRESPPEALVASLKRLGVGEAAWSRAARIARRYSSEARKTEALWLDALRQAGDLTPFQLSEIRAGRADRLRVASYFVLNKLAIPNYVDGFAAKDSLTGKTVWLFLFSETDPEKRIRLLASIRDLDRKRRTTNAPPIDDDSGCDSYDADANASQTESNPLPHFIEYGLEGESVFLAAESVAGRSLVEWQARFERLAGQYVFEIAQEIAAALARFERCGIDCADLDAADVYLTEEGDVSIPFLGLRRLCNDNSAQNASDAERSAAASLAAICRCLLFGPRLSWKTDLKISPDVPPPLAVFLKRISIGSLATEIMTAREIEQALGRPTRAGKESLAERLVSSRRYMTPQRRNYSDKLRQLPVWAAAALGVVSAVMLLVWPMLRRSDESRAIPGKFVAVAAKPLAPPKNANRKIVLNEPKQIVVARSKENAEGVVSQANYIQTQTKSIENPRQIVDVSPPDMLLHPGINDLRAPKADEATTTPSHWTLAPGRRVIGKSGLRAQVIVPSEGLTVDGENNCFENIDFLWKTSDEKLHPGPDVPAMIRLRAANVEFRRCGFFVERDSASQAPIAVEWSELDAAMTAENEEDVVRCNRATFKSCVFRGASVALDCRRQGQTSVEADNVLFLDCDAVFRFDHPSDANRVSLRGTTLRDGGPLACFEGAPGLAGLGPFAISARSCVFAPKDDAPLLSFHGEFLPDQIVKRTVWGGAGSIITPRRLVAEWKNDEGVERGINDSLMNVSGLVQGEVQFAAEPSDDPRSSGAVDWHAPLSSVNPPGVQTEDLPRFTPNSP